MVGLTIYQRFVSKCEAPATWNGHVCNTEDLGPHTSMEISVEHSLGSYRLDLMGGWKRDGVFDYQWRSDRVAVGQFLA